MMPARGVSPARSRRARGPRPAWPVADLRGVRDALSELWKPRYPGEGFAADRGFLRHPPPPCLPDLQFPLHHFRAGAVARIDRHQAQRPARAVRPRQAVALGADRLPQAPGRSRAHRPDGVEDRARTRKHGRKRGLVRGDRRDRDGAFARSRRRRLCALRLGLPQFPRSQGFRDRAGRIVWRRGRGDRAQVSGEADRRFMDLRFMDLALSLGRRRRGKTWPNPAVGAVIVKDGVIVGRGWTQPGGRPHAEVEALRRAGEAAGGATLYVTLEPCSHYGKSPPCADAVIATGLSRVVSAIEDPNPEVAGAGHARLRAAGIAVDVGLCADEARHDHAGHILRMTKGRPRVLLKLAISADGKAGAAGGKPVAITGEEVRARVHLLRAENDAIMVGIGTALADDPQLTCRLPGMAKRSPVRVIADSALRLPVQSQLAQSARDTPVWAICASGAA